MTVNYGLFINSIITFLIIAFAVFLIVRAANRMRPAGSGGRAEHQGLPLLPDADPGRRDPVPAVHVRAPLKTEAVEGGCSLVPGRSDLIRSAGE